jgi:hypothetical protein
VGAGVRLLVPGQAFRLIGNKLSARGLSYRSLRLPSQSPTHSRSGPAPVLPGPAFGFPAMPDEKELASVPKGVPNNSEAARARAEALFERRESKRAEAPLAWAEYR